MTAASTPMNTVRRVRVRLAGVGPMLMRSSFLVPTSLAAGIGRRGGAATGRPPWARPPTQSRRGDTGSAPAPAPAAVRRGDDTPPAGRRTAGGGVHSDVASHRGTLHRDFRYATCRWGGADCTAGEWLTSLTARTGAVAVRYTHSDGTRYGWPSSGAADSVGIGQQSTRGRARVEAEWTTHPRCGGSSWLSCDTSARRTSDAAADRRRAGLVAVEGHADRERLGLDQRHGPARPARLLRRHRPRGRRRAGRPRPPLPPRPLAVRRLRRRVLPGRAAVLRLRALRHVDRIDRAAGRAGAAADGGVRRAP